MKIIEQAGPFKVVEQRMQNRSPKRGLKQVWTEFQVRQGRKVLARHDLARQAIEDMHARIGGEK